jgi:hypothetical protein
MDAERAIFIDIALRRPHQMPPSQKTGAALPEKS